MDNELFKMAGKRNPRYLDFPPHTKVRLNSEISNDTKTTCVVGYMFLDLGGIIVRDGLGDNLAHFFCMDELEIVHEDDGLKN